MTLEEAWKLLESLNEDANRESQQFWMSDNIKAAIRYQSACFRKNFLKLDKIQRQQIRLWITRDEEFQDYFRCLIGDKYFYRYRLKI